MLKFIDKKPQTLKGMLLIVSGISIGNVGALTCDQIIQNSGFNRIAFYNTSYIEPSVGYLPQNIQNGALGLPAQLYHRGDTLILQFRSFCRFARKKDLAKQIIQTFKKQGVEQIVVISSLPYDVRPDLQIGAVQRNIFFKCKGKVTDMNIKQNSNAKLLSISHLADDEDMEEQIQKKGGLAHVLYKQAANIILLFIFSQEKEDHSLVKYYEKYLSKLIGRKDIA